MRLHCLSYTQNSESRSSARSFGRSTIFLSMIFVCTICISCTFILTGFVVDVVVVVISAWMVYTHSYTFQQKLKRSYKGSYHFSNSIEECLFLLFFLFNSVVCSKYCLCHVIAWMKLHKWIPIELIEMKRNEIKCNDSKERERKREK